MQRYFEIFDWISGLCFIVIHVPLLGRRPISVWCCQIAHTLIGLTSQLNWLTTTMSPAQHNEHFGDLESWQISKNLLSHLFIAIWEYNLPIIIVWFEFIFSINRVYAAFSHWTLVHVSWLSSDHGWPPSIPSCVPLWQKNSSQPIWYICLKLETGWNNISGWELNIFKNVECCD